MTISSQDVSVIICAYTEERWDDLVAAVESLRTQRVLPLEVIVVIDHNPGLLQRVQTHISDVVIAENKEQRGLSGARNSGIAVAQGHVIAFMDEDATAESDWTAQLSTGYDDPNVIGVGGAIVPLWLSGRPRWFPEEFDWVVGCTYRGMPKSTTSVRNLIGCNMSFRREVFATVGGFVNGLGRIGTLPVGCEETELCIRTQQVHPKSSFLYIPAAKVHHRVPQVRARWSYFCSRCYAEGLSKALVTQLAGAQEGLATERTYTFRTLPLGVVRNLSAAIRGDLAGLGRAAAIVSGLLITSAGYVRGALGQRIAKKQRVDKSQVLSK